MKIRKRIWFTFVTSELGVEYLGYDDTEIHNSKHENQILINVQGYGDSSQVVRVLGGY